MKQETLTAGTTAPMVQESRHRLAGDIAIWIFILAELLAFGVFFIAYAFTRANHIELFDAEQAALNRLLIQSTRMRITWLGVL